MQKQQRLIGDHLRVAEVRIEKTENEIADEYAKLDAANGGSHTRRLAEKDEKQSKVVEAQNRLEEHTSSFSTLDADRKRAEQELEQVKTPIQAKRNEVRQCEEQLNNLRRDRGQQQGGFHPNMPRLLRAIQKEGGFQETPIGPVGSHVRLLQSSWSTILEKSFGGMLDSFVVMSKSDQGLLSRLMKEVGWYGLCPLQCVFRQLLADHAAFAKFLLGTIGPSILLSTNRKQTSVPPYASSRFVTTSVVKCDNR